MNKIAVIGLGYVGLPLAYEFSKVHDCVGYDISEKRILELKKGVDKTEDYLEIDFSKVLKRKHILYDFKSVLPKKILAH